jgi:hypothetical protein
MGSAALVHVSVGDVAIKIMAGPGPDADGNACMAAARRLSLQCPARRSSSRAAGAAADLFPVSSAHGLQQAQRLSLQQRPRYIGNIEGRIVLVRGVS